MEAVRVANQAREAGVDPDAHHTAWAAWDAAFASALEAAAAGADALVERPRPRRGGRRCRPEARARDRGAARRRRRRAGARRRGHRGRHAGGRGHRRRAHARDPAARRRVRPRRGVPAADDDRGRGDEGGGRAREDVPARLGGLERGPRRVRDGEGRHPLDRQGHLRVAAREPGLRRRRPRRRRRCRARSSRPRATRTSCASRRS